MGRCTRGFQAVWNMYMNTLNNCLHFYVLSHSNLQEGGGEREKAVIQARKLGFVLVVLLGRRRTNEGCTRCVKEKSEGGEISGKLERGREKRPSRFMLLLMLVVLVLICMSNEVMRGVIS